MKPEMILDASLANMKSFRELRSYKKKPLNLFKLYKKLMIHGCKN
jgi:hypothetical protein